MFNQILINKPPDQIQTQTSDDALGIHTELASLLHQVPCINPGCRLLGLELQRGCLGGVLPPLDLGHCHLLVSAAQPVSEGAEGNHRLCPRSTMLLFPVWQMIKGKPGRQDTWKPSRNKFRNTFTGRGEELFSIVPGDTTGGNAQNWKRDPPSTRGCQ